MFREPNVRAVVRSASRRWLWVLVFEHAAFPCAVGLAGAAILLILGTDILNWFWPVLLAGAAVVYAAFRIRRRMLPPYRVAQVLDRRLGLNDSLATAWFLLSRHGAAQAGAAEFQIGQAEQVASSIRPAAALPFPGRRKWAVTASLLAIAFGLFTVRYFKIETLSLRPPLVPVPIAALLDVERLFSPHTESVPLMRRSLPLKGVSQTAHAGQQPRGSDASEANADSSSGTVPGKAAKPNTNQNQRASAAGANPDAGRPDTTSSPSLLQRMKAALASLASDLRAHVAGKRSPHGDSQAKATRSLAQTQPSGSRQASAQRGANTQAKAVQKQGASLRNSQASSRKGSEAKSGIGSQNGEKDLRRAEELAAMGKLAEILGKRSADLTGEMTVRSVSGTAALRTRDTRRLGRHEDLGGEIQRNEVPPMYRDYVRRYMEEARKVAEQSAK